MSFKLSLLVIFLCAASNLCSQGLGDSLSNNKTTDTTIKNNRQTKEQNKEQGEVKYITDYRAGLYAAYLLNSHTTNATVFSGGGECGAFGNGTGKGFAITAFGELPLFSLWEDELTKMFDLVLGLGFSNRSGAFSQAYTAGLPILDPNTNKYTTLKQTHSYSASVSYLDLSLGIKFTPFPIIPVFMRVMGSYGLKFGSGVQYEQIAEITQPSGVVYPETGRADKTVGSGEVLNSQNVLGMLAALGYSYSLDSNITIAPEIGYYKMFSSVTSDFDWKITSLQLGVSGIYSFVTKVIPPLPPPVPIPPPPVAKKPVPKPVLAILNSPKVEVKETVVTETFPVLNYIFFANESNEIPKKYIAQRSAYNPDSLPKRSLETYYQALNILGSRLANSKTKITISGTSDGKELASNKERQEIAMSRAKTVAEYFEKEWNIDPKRMTVRALKTPTYPTNYDYSEGDEENRRVEITSNDDEFLKPIIFDRFIERTITPNQIKLSTDVVSEAKIKSWSVKISLADRIIWEQSGEGNPPTELTYSPNLSDARSIASVLLYDTTKQELKQEDSVLCTFSVTSTDSITNISTAKIPVSRELSPLELSRLSLIVFDFDRDEITTANRNMISSFVARSISKNSDIEITGSTDKLGEAEHNKSLSEARAVAVQKLIKKEKKDAKSITTKGIGAEELLYDNASPEGRYYCRTVRVQVSMPLRREGIK